MELVKPCKYIYNLKEEKGRTAEGDYDAFPPAIEHRASFFVPLLDAFDRRMFPIRKRVPEDEISVNKFLRFLSSFFKMTHFQLGSFPL